MHQTCKSKHPNSQNLYGGSVAKTIGDLVSGVWDGHDNGFIQFREPKSRYRFSGFNPVTNLRAKTCAESQPTEPKHSRCTICGATPGGFAATATDSAIRTADRARSSAAGSE